MQVLIFNFFLNKIQSHPVVQEIDQFITENMIDILKP